MAPKRGLKRKAAGPVDATDNSTNGNATFKVPRLTPPDPKTWPGWVEVESEPAFFNRMLEQLGAKGVQVQELWSPEDQIPFLPQPIHGFIFLFRYQDSDQAEVSDSSNTDHVWFAKQVPDHACATIAMLNIINNIPALIVGPELRNFKDATRDQSPEARGQAINNFDFARQIHNSFATENDLLEADLLMQQKLKKRLAIEKALATKRAKKEAHEKALQDAAADESPTNADQHQSNEAAQDADSKSDKSTTETHESKFMGPAQDTDNKSDKATINDDQNTSAEAAQDAASKSDKSTTKPDQSTSTEAAQGTDTKPDKSTTNDDQDQSNVTTQDAPSKSCKPATNGNESTPLRRSSRNKKSTEDSANNADGAFNPDSKRKAKTSNNNQPESEPKPDSEQSTPTRKSLRSRKPTNNQTADTSATSTAKAESTTAQRNKNKRKADDDIDAHDDNGDAQPRRSGRSRKKPKTYADEAGDEEPQLDETFGFHFNAIIPVQNDVVKVDGLDPQPTILGSFGAGESWVDAALPHIRARMAQFQGKSIEFNLMAVIHDPILEDRQFLLENVKMLHEIDTRLAAIVEDWYELEGGDTAPALLTVDRLPSLEFEISRADVAASGVAADKMAEIEGQAEDLHELLVLRKRAISRQGVLRESISEAIAAKRNAFALARENQLKNDAYGPLTEELLKKHASK
ncbi:hypothetical protein DOTSEDRAFT_179147 [Lecanosticta acicola]|uniref:Ubiquitin carboxyl-terminal hydrolase n=1 Tax=Lecanosticta acicola TaxID=111012 RepID=A0AAI8Z4I1_9PEZI|nr:hypothetical protein DOTSEDRAFT_179147 [Lecanosticta acicola]